MNVDLAEFDVFKPDAENVLKQLVMKLGGLASSPSRRSMVNRFRRARRLKQLLARFFGRTSKRSPAPMRSLSTWRHSAALNRTQEPCSKLGTPSLAAFQRSATGCLQQPTQSALPRTHRAYGATLGCFGSARLECCRKTLVFG